MGDWRAINDELRLEALTSAGLLGKSTSVSQMLPNLMHMKYEGHVMRNGRKVAMEDFVIPAVPRPLDIPVVLQDREFTNDGQLSFEIDAADMEAIAGMDRGDGVAWASGDPIRAD